MAKKIFPTGPIEPDLNEEVRKGKYKEDAILKMSELKEGQIQFHRHRGVFIMLYDSATFYHISVSRSDGEGIHCAGFYHIGQARRHYRAIKEIIHRCPKDRDPAEELEFLLEYMVFK